MIPILQSTTTATTTVFYLTSEANLLIYNFWHLILLILFVLVPLLMFYIFIDLIFK